MSDFAGMNTWMLDTLGLNVPAYAAADPAAAAVQQQMPADNQRDQQARWDAQQQVQTRVFETTQDVTASTQQAAERAADAMDGSISQ